jgi:signal transduction histidine kinase
VKILKQEGSGVKILKQIASSIVVVSFMALATALGSLLVRRWGLPEFVTALLSAAIGLVALFTVFSTIMNLMRRSHIHDIDNMHKELIYTFNEIASGNFNVFVKPDPHSPHNEIAVAMNEMTRKLGSAETMRQDFISNVSHEIRSPLTGISGFAELLEKDEITDEQRRRYAKIIKTESKRLSSLSDNLLKLSTLDNNRTELSKTAFRLDKQLQQAIITLEPQSAAKNITLEVDLPKCEITADADLLSQMWMNLIHNAIKFTPDGGTITVSIEATDVITIKIIDTGIGISKSDQIHIFERFYKVDKSRDRSLGGNGLGLSIVRRIVELHDGRIGVESEVGKGTTFKITLPK